LLDAVMKPFFLFLMLLMTMPIPAADLRPEMKAKFYDYVKQVAERVEREVTQTESILYLNTLAEAERREYEQKGFYMLNLLERSASPVVIEGAMVHHYIGGVFIPGKTVSDVLRIVQDYDEHAIYYQPDVIRSKLLRRDDEHFEIYYRLRRRHVIAATLDVESVVTYQKLSPTRAVSRSRSRSIREVRDAGQPSESVLPEGQGLGLLWLMETFWRFEARSEGVWVECEAISLTRDLPWGLRSVLKGYIASISYESLEFTLVKTKEAALKK